MAKAAEDADYERRSYELLGRARHFDPEDEHRCDRMADKLSKKEAQVKRLEPREHLHGTWVSSE